MCLGSILKKIKGEIDASEDWCCGVMGSRRHSHLGMKKVDGNVPILSEVPFIFMRMQEPPFHSERSLNALLGFLASLWNHVPGHRCEVPRSRQETEWSTDLPVNMFTRTIGLTPSSWYTLFLISRCGINAIGIDR